MRPNQSLHLVHLPVLLLAHLLMRPNQSLHLAHLPVLLLARLLMRPIQSLHLVHHPVHLLAHLPRLPIQSLHPVHLLAHHQDLLRILNQNQKNHQVGHRNLTSRRDLQCEDRWNDERRFCDGTLRQSCCMAN